MVDWKRDNLENKKHKKDFCIDNTAGDVVEYTLMKTGDF